MSVTGEMFELLEMKQLPEAPWKYFIKTPGAMLVPLSKLETTRARPKGIANAEPHMARAYTGEGKRRKPISVKKLGGGKYRVMDGNSTTAIARKHGWKSIPAELVKEEDKQTMWKESADVLGRTRVRVEARMPKGLHYKRGQKPSAAAMKSSMQVGKWYVQTHGATKWYFYPTGIQKNGSAKGLMCEWESNYAEKAKKTQVSKIDGRSYKEVDKSSVPPKVVARVEDRL
jgi:hypothetical protein